MDDSAAGGCLRVAKSFSQTRAIPSGDGRLIDSPIGTGEEKNLIGEEVHVKGEYTDGVPIPRSHLVGCDLPAPQPIPNLRINAIVARAHSNSCR